MGAWGTALFADDTACDVRDDFRELLGDGLSAVAATKRVLTQWSDALEDADERPIVWLALAATQWRTGHVVPRVLREAITIIDSGSSLAPWNATMRAQLVSPPPAPKRIRKLYRDDCDWQIGEVVAYTTKKGRRVFLWVVDEHVDAGGRSPVCELLAWRGRSMPTVAQLRRAGSHKVRGERRSQFMVGRTSQREMPNDRILRTSLRIKPVPKTGPYRVFLWRMIDALLRSEYGVK
jgi:hypothetical protein